MRRIGKLARRIAYWSDWLWLRLFDATIGLPHKWE